MEDFIQQMTIECLMNSNQMNKWKSKKQNTDNEQEYRFYKKRIVHLVKQMLLSSEFRDEIGNDISNSFRVFAHLVIKHFKKIDTNEIYQKEYHDMSFNFINSSKCFNEEELMATNQLLMRVQSDSKTMDEFVQKTQTKEEPIIYPKKRKINLKESYFKNKGLCKKKNLNNNYVDNQTEIVQKETPKNEEKENVHC